MNKVLYLIFRSWRELHACFKQIATDSDVRAVVISGTGKLFTAGIDCLLFTILYFYCDLYVGVI